MRHNVFNFRVTKLLIFMHNINGIIFYSVEGLKFSTKIEEIPNRLLEVDDFMIKIDDQKEECGDTGHFGILSHVRKYTSKAHTINRLTCSIFD